MSVAVYNTKNNELYGRINKILNKYYKLVPYESVRDYVSRIVFQNHLLGMDMADLERFVLNNSLVILSDE